jgi:hypothetical protein
VSSYTPTSDVTLYAHSTFNGTTYETWGTVETSQNYKPDCSAYTGMSVQVRDANNNLVETSSASAQPDANCGWMFSVNVPAGDLHLVLTIITSHPEYFTSASEFVSSGATSYSVVLTKSFVSGPATDHQFFAYITP